jgi:hypothetical protein
MEGFDIGHAGREEMSSWHHHIMPERVPSRMRALAEIRGAAAKFGYHAGKQHKTFKSRIFHG